MLRLRLQHAKPGMELAVPIYHPLQPSVVLLRAGVVLDAHTIPQLMQMGIFQAYIKYPGLEHLLRHANMPMLEQQRRMVSTLARTLDDAIASHNVSVDYYACRRTLAGLVRQVLSDRDHAAWMGDLAGGGSPFVRHSANVTYLCLLMGLKLDFYLLRERSRVAPHRAKELTSLGMGALFHDIGMLSLPEADLARYNAARDDADPAFRNHCAAGYDMVRGRLDPTAATIVLHHHQRYDGSGFPLRPSFVGEPRPAREHETHVFARICAAADLLDRLRHPAHAPHSSDAAAAPVPTVRVLKRLAQGPERAWLDPVVFRALFCVMPPYAPGTIVELSDGAHAVVSDWTPQDPCRPTVELLLPEPIRQKKQGGKVVRVDLREHPKLLVSEHDGHKVLEDNFFPTCEDEFDLAGLYRAMRSIPAPEGNANDNTDTTDPAAIAAANESVTGGATAYGDGQPARSNEPEVNDDAPLPPQRKAA